MSNHLVAARADGSRQRDLTPPAPDTRDHDSQFSPNGHWIAYERDQGTTATIHLGGPTVAMITLSMSAVSSRARMR